MNVVFTGGLFSGGENPVSVLVTDIPFVLDVRALLDKNHLEPGSEDAAEFEHLAHRTKDLARPKALYRECFIDSKGEDSVTVDGVTFTSLVLRRNLDGVERIFPYIATCGTEIDDAHLAEGDPLLAFWIDTIKAVLLNASRTHLAELLQQRYGLHKASVMNPGSGDAETWPIEQQKDLFALLGNVEESIGVRLLDSFLMLPNKTVSGIRFPSEVDFHNCRLCHREDCPGRKGPFDQELWASIHEKG